MRFAVVLLAGCLPALDAGDPPALSVTSPTRSLVQDQAGPLAVAGTAAPGAQVTVNGAAANVAADGSFTATVQLQPGATLIHTVATAPDGGVSTDTRSVEAGERRAPGTPIANAIATSISAPAFAKIAEVATSLIKSANLTALVAPLNPIVHAGDPMGPDCLFAEAFVDAITIGDAHVSLAPVSGGLHTGAELDTVDITGHLNYAVACVNGTKSFEVSASVAALDGVITLTPGGMAGVTVDIANPSITLTGLHITATGVPSQILNLLPLDKVISAAAPLLVKTFVGPMLNKAVGALTAPQKIQLLGKTIDIQVTPSAVAFDASAGAITLDTSLLIEGTESSPGFTSTPSGMPALSPGNGLVLGLAADLANEVLAELTATGLLDLPLPAMGGPLDASIAATSPPMITADNNDLRLVLPDLMLTFSDHGTPVAHAALNAQVDLAIASSAGTLSLQLGTPAIAIDVLDDDSHVTEGGAGQAASMGTSTQLGSILPVLQSIPLPSIAGLTLGDVSVTGSDGYVLIGATLQ